VRAALPGVEWVSLKQCGRWVTQSEGELICELRWAFVQRKEAEKGEGRLASSRKTEKQGNLFK